jgi:hypothetical protein
MTERGASWGKTRLAGATRRARWLGVSVGALLAGAALGGGCGGQAGTTATDTNTNWLRDCDTDSDCGSALSCLCGICTVTCDSTRVCKSVGGRGVCNTSSSCKQAPAVCEDEGAGVAGGGTVAPDVSVETGGTGSAKTSDDRAGADAGGSTQTSSGAAGLPDRPSTATGGAPNSRPPSTGGVASTGGKSTGGGSDLAGAGAGGLTQTTSGAAGLPGHVPSTGGNSIGGAPSVSRPSGMGPCTDEWIDFGCDSILDPCPTGMHRDFDVSDPCAICVDDPATPLSCEAARARYTALLEHVIPSSCADYCEEDADCAVYTFDNACSSGCHYAVYTAIDEDIIEVASQFSAESCLPVCGDSSPPTCTDARLDYVAQCVSNRCVLVERGG